MNLEEMREKALAATPGPWAANIYDDDRQRTIATVATVEGWVVGPDCKSERLVYDLHGSAMDDAAYIAALNPAVALKLLAVVQAAGEHTKALDNLREMMGQGCNNPGDAVVFRRLTEDAQGTESALRSALGDLGEGG